MFYAPFILESPCEVCTYFLHTASYEWFVLHLQKISKFLITRRIIYIYVILRGTVLTTRSTKQNICDLHIWRRAIITWFHSDREKLRYNYFKGIDPAAIDVGHSVNSASTTCVVVVTQTAVDLPASQLTFFNSNRSNSSSVDQFKRSNVSESSIIRNHK